MFAIVSYLFAFLAGDNLVVWQIVMGVIIFSILTGATNMINAYTDIEEDRINNPFRVEWITQLGLKNLLRSTILTYLVVLALSLPLGPVFSFIVLLAVLDSIFYSLPPLRFKKWPVTALLSFSGAVGFPFLAGLAVIDQLNVHNPLLILLTFFMLNYGTVKNIPDFVGDRLVGLRTTATIFKDHRRAVIVSTILLLTPYLNLILFVGLNLLDHIYLLSTPLMAFPIYWAIRNLQTEKREVMEKLHTYGFLYAVFFLLYNLVLTYPSMISVGIAIVVYLMIYFVTRLQIDSRRELPINLG
jgi:4-hydroxybenzoate polyprenyltransferase